MKQIEVPFAQGIDQSVDPRMAPSGTLTRVQNLRLDREGRMVLRNGYQSLGLTVHGTLGAASLVPFDLHNYNGQLVALGNHGIAVTGIRFPYQFVNTFDGKWKTPSPFLDGTVALSNDVVGFAAADSVRVAFSSYFANSTDITNADCAVNTAGFVCMVADGPNGFGFDIQIIDPATSTIIFNTSTATGALFARVLAIGTKFFIFVSNVGTLTVSTFDTASSTTISATTALSAALSAAGVMDCAVLEGASTDYLIVFATATGYTVERRTSANALVWSTATVALVGAPVSVCGLVGVNVSVLTGRAASGAELRTYNPTTGALVVGPTNVDVSATVMTWVAVAQMSATQVLCTYVTEASLVLTKTFATIATVAAHALTQRPTHGVSRAFSKPIIVDGCAFVWSVLGGATFRPFALVNMDLATLSLGGACIAGIAMDGLAKPSWSVKTAPAVSHITSNGGKFYCALVTKDPRDKTFRPNVIECNIFSGQRRQSIVAPDGLYLAGGATTRFDGLASEAGSETQPTILTATPQAGGAMTPLGVYQTVLVYRYVGKDGSVQRSAPSEIVTTTLGGADTNIGYVTTSPYCLLRAQIGNNYDVRIYIDVFRTEAGGSIPRLVFSSAVLTPFFGDTKSFAVGVSDVIQQTGQPIYTQGADGAVSGRLPLGLASSCKFIVESGGKVLLGGLERDTQCELSIERRPGEQQGFVNDDLLFVTAPDTVTGLATGTDGRRFIFGRQTIRELLGDGPNAAGVGDLSEPVEVDGQVGCNDWRSIGRTEHGIFFRSDDNKIYLLPRNGGASISAAESIQDVLEAFPITTSVTRHDADQLLTFTVANAALTDGRLLHLDLKTSGMDPKRGWVGRWIIDRVPVLEALPDIEVIGEESYTVAVTGTRAVPLRLPFDRIIGERVIWFVSVQGVASLQVVGAPAAGYTRTGAVTSVSLCQAWYEKIIDGTEVETNVFCVQDGMALVHRWHIKNAHPSQALEVTTLITNPSTTQDPPLLTPSWGSAKNMWFVSLAGSLAITALPPTSGVNENPAGFDHEGTIVVQAAAQNGGICNWGRQLLSAASLNPGAFLCSSAQDGITSTVAVRPAVTAPGTPVRASVQFNGRLVVCNATDVLQNTAGSFADGTAFIQPEIETATIYAMGQGGAARHLGMVFVGEYRDRCILHCRLSYDDGLTYTELTPHTLDDLRYTPSQTIRVQWVPRRRKVEGVRAIFSVTGIPGTGASEGLVFQKCIFQFDDIMGVSRLPGFFRK